MAGDTVINITTYNDRESLWMAKLQAYFASKGKPEVKIQPFTIRVEKQLQQNDTNFMWKLAQRANQLARETYLTDNDGFFMLAMAIMVLKEPVLTGNYERGGNVPLYAYPDKNVFNAAATAANVSESNALEAIYNGYLTAKSDTEEVLYQLETDRFRKVPYFQFSGTTMASYTGDQYEMLPMPTVFEGKKTNDFMLQFAPGADTVQINGDPTVTPATSANRLVILHRGLVLRNVSEPTTFMELRRMVQNSAR